MSRMRSRWASAVLLAGLVPTPVVAHPGSGIVVDRQGQVYFLDTGSGLWKIDTHGALTRIAPQRFHWLALDADDRFRSAQLPSGAGGDITRVGSTPTLLLASDYPLAVGSDGNLYYPARGSGSSSDIMRLLPSGLSSVFTHLSLSHLNGIATAPDGTLYYTENSAIRRIDAQGKVSTFAARVALRDCPSIPGNDANDPLLRGLAVDSGGTVYVAASGCGRVLKITAGGQIATLVQTESPWSPTAVALFGRDVYVLEYLHTAVEDRLQWLPRIRKISPDGKSVIIATVSR